MKLLALIPVAPLAAAFVLPDQQVFQQLSVEPNDRIINQDESLWESIKHEATSYLHKTHNALDEGIAHYYETATAFAEEVFDGSAWFESSIEHLYGNNLEDDEERQHHDRPHHKGHHDDHAYYLDEQEDRDEPPSHDKPPHDKPHKGKPGKGKPGKGKHGKDKHRHHHEINETIYQSITSSKYTTKLAELLDDFPEIVEILNSTEHNITFFAPSNKAFEKIPENGKKPSKEQIEKVLKYHIVPSVYPAGKVLVSHTAPTLLEGTDLSEETVPQRISFHIGLRGLTVNFRSRVIAIDIFATNGVIHGLDSFILPPPPALKILEFLPTEFSTLSLGLAKTGLLDKLDQPHKGGTLFAPSNSAFAKLPAHITGFLFSKAGEKYLKALLEYHVVPKVDLYSDAVYNYDDKKEELTGKHGHGIPKGLYHLELDTLLENRKLSIDIARFGGFINFKINAFSNVVVQDGIAKDGVIQVVNNVLIPPKKLSDGALYKQDVNEMSLEDFKAVFDGLL